jgi:TM2 domain-containing membrane protein YozV
MAGAPGYPGYPQFDPATGQPLSDKTKLVAGLLNIFIAGVGRMYMGHVGIGVAQLIVAIVTCGLGALWSLIDGILILINGGYDGQGRRLRDQ